MHLLTECPYTLEVLQKLGMQHITFNNVLGVSLNLPALEIRSDLIIHLVFRLQIMPPDVLIKTTLEKYAKGLAIKPKIKLLAEKMLRDLQI